MMIQGQKSENSPRCLSRLSLACSSNIRRKALEECSCFFACKKISPSLNSHFEDANDGNPNLLDHDKQIAKKQDRVSAKLNLYDRLTEDAQEMAFLLMNSLHYYRFSDRSPD